jgi:hypothetical protein
VDLLRSFKETHLAELKLEVENSNRVSGCFKVDLKTEM